MSGRSLREPGPYHPITIAPAAHPVEGRAGGALAARSVRALALHEATYPAAYYIPLDDITARLIPSETRTWCPFKGEASYFHLETADGERIVDAVWTYGDPAPAVAAIAGHGAFYAGKVDVIADR